MSDFENVVHAARLAQQDGQEIDDATARVIGSLYHDGQASVSYSFASTGRIGDPTDVYRECFPAYDAMAPNEKLVADMFGTYLMNRANRDAVKGWSRLWLHEPTCRHSWVAGMMHVHDEDLETVAATRTVECERCEATYDPAEHDPYA